MSSISVPARRRRSSSHTLPMLGKILPSSFPDEALEARVDLPDLAHPASVSRPEIFDPFDQGFDFLDLRLMPLQLGLQGIPETPALVRRRLQECLECLFRLPMFLLEKLYRIDLLASCSGG